MYINLKEKIGDLLNENCDILIFIIKLKKMVFYLIQFLKNYLINNICDVFFPNLLLV